MPVVAPDTPAPAFALPSTGAGLLSLRDVLAGGSAVTIVLTLDFFSPEATPAPEACCLIEEWGRLHHFG